MNALVLYVVRHAHTDWTPDEGRSLSVRGRADAGRVAQVLAGLPLAAVYASSARRAQQTVAPLAAQCGVDVVVCDAFRERVVAAHPVGDFAATLAWLWANPTQSLPGGESNVAARARGVAALLPLLRRHRGQQFAIGSHGNLLALLLQHVDASIDYAFWQAMTMPDVYRMEWAGTRFVGWRRCWPADH